MVADIDWQQPTVWPDPDDLRRGARQPPVERLFDDIAAQLVHRPVPDAAAAIAEHIALFWAPRMRAELVERLSARNSDTLAIAVAALVAGSTD